MREIANEELKEMFNYQDERLSDMVLYASQNVFRLCEIIKKYCPQEEWLEIDWQMCRRVWPKTLIQFKPQWWSEHNFPSWMLYARFGYHYLINLHVINKVFSEEEKMFYHHCKLELEGFYTEEVMQQSNCRKPSEENPELFNKYFTTYIQNS